MDRYDIAAIFTVTGAALLILAITYSAVTADRYPESTEDCPPDHVYIDYGETPQRGCMPLGVARELGVWPRP